MSTALRVMAWSLALILAVLPVVAVLNGWFANDRWPIERLSVEAEYRRVDENAIRQAVQPHVARGFFAVDLEAVRTSVASLAWVATVDVRKRWPNALEITIREHRPFARWGEGFLVSVEGQVFEAPSGAPEQLPVLDSPRERLSEALSFYQQAEPLVRELGQPLEMVRLSPRGSWSLRLGANSRLMIGRAEPLTRLREVWPLLVKVVHADPRPLLRADFRYGNGFALRWGEASAPATDVATGTGT